MKNYFLIFLSVFCIFSNKVYTQHRLYFEGFDDDIRGKNGLRVMFYNLENFFDTQNDSITSDDEYTSFGMKHWGREKYANKLNSIYKAILSVGGWEPPEIIGVCEVENKFVMGDIAMGTPLRKFNYKFIHHDSPDSRGIDVGLLYRSDKFKPIYNEAIKIIYPFDTSSKTRDILYVKGIIANNDTIHLFINHFPSKFGGANITIPKRNFVATLLRNKVDSLLNSNSNSNILIMGDFNDEPADESISKFLNAKCDTFNLRKTDLYNLMCNLKTIEKIGSNKFRENWSLIDQIIVSNSLINLSKGWKVKNNRAFIFKAEFLLIADETYMGLKTFRTYNGPKYTGGFSDHLPVYVDLIYK
jgi:predicted extracellular nuclease